MVLVLNLIILAEQRVHHTINLLQSSFYNYTIRTLSSPKLRYNSIVNTINAIYPIDMWKDYVLVAEPVMPEVINVINVVKFTKQQHCKSLNVRFVVQLL